MADINNKEAMKIPETLPLIPLRDLIIFPNLVVPLFVGREKSIKALEEVMREDKKVLLVAQKNAAAHRFDKPPVQIPRLGIGEVDLLLFGNDLWRWFVFFIRHCVFPDNRSGPSRGASRGSGRHRL